MSQTKYRKRGTRHAHRCVAEEKLGRPLRPGEVVHHIDGNSLNNAPENLKVLASQAEHARLHNSGIKRTPKSRCKNGHSLSPENIFLTSAGRRRCLTCARDYDNRWKKDKRVARGLKQPGAKPGSLRNRPRNSKGQLIRATE